MMSQPPPWPDSDQPTQSGQPMQPPGAGRRPALFSSLFSSRSQLVIAVVAVVSSVLVVALFGTLLLVLSSNARGTQAQTGQTGQTATTGSAQATETDDANGTSTPGSSGGSGGGTRHTSTPTPTPGTHAPPSVHQVVNQITLSGSGEGSVVATCPAGELALSGGWAIPYTLGATIYRSSRTGTRGWGVYVNHPTSVVATSYAECLKDASGATMAERSASVSITPRFVGGAYPKCHAGEVVVGSGYAFDVHTDVYLATFRENSSDTQWEGQAVDWGTISTLATVYAECLAYSGASMHATALTESGVIAAGGVSSTYSLACPSGYLTSGGGFVAAAGAFVYDMQTQLVLGDSGGSYRVWKVSLYADRGNQNNLLVEAICLGFS